MTYQEDNIVVYDNHTMDDEDDYCGEDRDQEQCAGLGSSPA
jgi:hypothetical protein